MKPRIIFFIILIVLIAQCFNKEKQANILNDTTTNEASTEQSSDKSNEEDTKNKDTTDIPSTPVTMPTKLPESKIILPIRRIGTSESALNVAPCGGIIRKEGNTLANKAANIHFVWETVTPAVNSNCTVKISPGIEKEENFTVLKPKGNIANTKGEFPCGANKGFEGQEFILPEDYVCDKCTLQWKWNTPYGTIYSCSDVIINGDKIGNCLAKCQNGGSCFNGKCICVDDYHGEFCQNTSIYSQI